MSEDIAGPLIAHRGACRVFPENTISAITGAAAMGYRWVEIDVQVSHDQVAVLMHDPEVDRTTDGSGPTAMKSGETLTNLHTRDPKTGALTHHAVPLLAEALQACLQCQLGLVLEIKTTAGWDVEDVGVVAEVVDAHWPRDNRALIVTSFSSQGIVAFGKKCGWTKRGVALLAPPHNPGAFMSALGVSAFHLDYRYVGSGDIQRLRSAGAEVAVATVNKPVLARRLLNEGAQGIITDDLSEL